MAAAGQPTEIRTGTAAGAANATAQEAVYLEAVEGRTFSGGASYWLDLIETRSPTAIPPPDDWFAGPRDSRWLLTVEGDAESLVCVRGSSAA